MRRTLVARARRSTAVLCAAAVAWAAAPGPASAQGGPAAEAPPDEYKQRMKNGVKLFQDGNFLAAIAEFEAAYRVRPNANPLVNVALCQKALFRYPRAIAALERALSSHEGTMDRADQESARKAIAEMRALLARVTVELTPAHAALIVDGEEQPASTEARRVVELGPGTHRIGARAEGFAAAEEVVTVVSGEVDRTLAIALTPDKGLVTVEAGDAQGAIAIDQQIMGYGRWSGFLTPGTHLVQIYRQESVIYAAHALVVAGKAQEIRPGQGGIPLAAPAAPPVITPPVVPPAPPPPRPLRPARQGPFVLGAGSLVWPLEHPQHFPDPEPNSGGAGAIRAGYQVNGTASFDVMLQYVNVAIHMKGDEGAKYTFEAGRLGLNLRLMTPGQTVRFVGSLGGGIAHDSVSFSPATVHRCPAEQCFDASGVDPFVLTDVGVELDFGGPLVGFSLESYFQSSRGIDDADDTDLYEPRALIHLGGSVRVGYAFW